MGTFVFKNAFLSVNSVDLSDHVRSLALSYSAEEKDDTLMGDDTKVRMAGLFDWSVSVEFAQDFAASKVDATLFPLIGAAAFALIIRPDAGTKSATNPEFTGDAVLLEYPILDGAVGDKASTSVSFSAAGDLSRATA